MARCRAHEVRHLGEFDGILIPGGFGNGDGGRSKPSGTPAPKNTLLGICLGFQMSVVEYARHVLGWENATSVELGKGGT